MMWHPQLSLALSLAIQAMVTTAPATAASDYSQNDDREADVAMEHWIVPSEAACVVSLALSAVVLALGVALLRLQRQYLARLNQLEAESSSKQNDDYGSRVISNSPPALSQAVVPATSVSYQPYGKGARLTTVQASLNQWTSALDFMTDAQRADVAANVGSIDVTMSLQAAINSGKPLYLPPGTYLVRLLQHIELEGGATVCALIARAGMQLRGSGWESTIIKLKDGESTDRSPQFFNIIASNRAISGLRLSGLRFDINGQNNPISPDRAAGKYNHFNCSMLIVSGSIKMTGADASLSDSRITDCWVENSPGVTCIGTGQSNQPLTALGRNVEIAHCVFHNNGLDTDDHSTLYMWGENMNVHDCTFSSTSMSSGKPGPNVACELHGAHNYFRNNSVLNYSQGLWCSGNQTTPVRHQIITGNSFVVCHTGIGFTGLIKVGAEALPMTDILIDSNTILITADHPITDDPKNAIGVISGSFLDSVRISNNIIRTTDTYYAFAVRVFPENATPPPRIGVGSVEIVCNTITGFAQAIVVGGSLRGAVASCSILNNRIDVSVSKTWPVYNSAISVGGKSTTERLRISGNGIRPCNAGGHLFYGIVIPDTATIGSLAMESNDIADEAQFDVSDKGLVRRRKGRQALTFTALPTQSSTTWKAGEVAYLSCKGSGRKLGAPGSQYLLKGWTRITDGSNSALNIDWCENHVPTGT